MTNVIVPELDHDAMMLSRFGHRMSPNGRLERRIVANLIAHIEANGYVVDSVYDGEEDTSVTDMKSAMELIFNLDFARLYVRPKASSPFCDCHSIVLTLGEGCDIVSDWTYSEGDKDGFDAAMDTFDADKFA
jgi:hypothetical protein